MKVQSDPGLLGKGGCWPVLLLALILLLAACLPLHVGAAPLMGGGQPPYQESSIRVDVSSTVGKLLANWRSWVANNYPDYIVSTAPYQFNGRWYVILLRYVVRPNIGVPLLPRIGCDRKPPLRPPGCPVIPG